MRNGTVSATNLTCYFHYGYTTRVYTCPQESQAEVVQGIAHAYGEYAFGDISPNSDCGRYNETSEILKSRNMHGYYCRRTRDRQEFAYRFLEYNKDDQQGVYPSFTNQIITASATQCFEYSEVSSAKTMDSNGILVALNYTYTNHSSNGNGSIVIPIQSGALGSTTYIYPGANIPQNAIRWNCGRRCIWMWAHKIPGQGENSTFYQCSINISLVSNTAGHYCPR